MRNSSHSNLIQYNNVLFMKITYCASLSGLAQLRVRREMSSCNVSWT